MTPRLRAHDTLRDPHIKPKRKRLEQSRHHGASLHNARQLSLRDHLARHRFGVLV